MLHVYSGYTDIESYPDLRPVELSVCTDLTAAEVQALGQGLTNIIHQLTGTRQYLRYYAEPEPTERATDLCLTFEGAPTVLTEPVTIRSLSYPAAVEAGGEEILDALGDGLLTWLEFNDDYLRSRGIITSNHRVDMGSIRLGREGENVFFEVDVLPPVGGIVPGPVEPAVENGNGATVVVDANGDAVAVTVEPEKKPVWPYIVGGGAALLLAGGLVFAATR